MTGHRTFPLGTMLSSQWQSYALVLFFVLLGAENAAACGMHAFGFSPYGAPATSQASAGAAAGLTLPRGTNLQVPRLVRVAANTPSTLTVTFNAPMAFKDAALTIDEPNGVRLRIDREQPVTPGDSSIILPFTATEGYHRLTLRLRGSVNDEIVTLTRHAYLLSRPSPEQAAR